MAWGQGAPDMSFWLGRKYAILQQQADAGSKQADTARIGTVAAANVDNVRAALMPKESAANIGLTAAQTGLANEQTQWFGKEAGARIRQMDAGTELTGTQNKVLVREALTPVSQLFGQVAGSLPGMGSVFSPRSSLLDPLPTRRRGESEVAYQDRINGL